MNNCKHLKIKLNRTFECKKRKKIITLNECTICSFKEYKTQSYSDFKNKEQKPIKMRSNKLSKLERNRKSLFTDNLDYCIICKRKREHLHEVFPGRNRRNSMKYNLVLPLCSTHHQLIHTDINMMTHYKKKGQAMFEEAYPDLDFVKIFKKNYK